jgi:hypothetical protein
VHLDIRANRFQRFQHVRRIDRRTLGLFHEKQLARVLQRSKNRLSAQLLSNRSHRGQVLLQIKLSSIGITTLIDAVYRLKDRSRVRFGHVPSSAVHPGHDFQVNQQGKEFAKVHGVAPLKHARQTASSGPMPGLVPGSISAEFEEELLETPTAFLQRHIFWQLARVLLRGSRRESGTMVATMALPECRRA